MGVETVLPMDVDGEVADIQVEEKKQEVSTPRAAESAKQKALKKSRSLRRKTVDPGALATTMDSPPGEHQQSASKKVRKRKQKRASM